MDKNNEIKDIEKLIEDKCTEDGNYVLVVKDHRFKDIGSKIKAWYDRKYTTRILLCLLGFFFIIFLIYALLPKVKVSASVQISVKEVSEKATLEVLTISDSVVVVEKEKDNSQGVTAWTKFTGNGYFIVDLQNSEFLIDEARKTVIVKTPDVTIDKDHFTLDYDDTETLFFNDKWFNGSYIEGVELAERQLNEAYVKIFEQIYTNPYYYDSAESAAEKIITSLVQNFNKGVEGLSVIVEVGALSENS